MTKEKEPQLVAAIPGELRGDRPPLISYVVLTVLEVERAAFEQITTQYEQSGGICLDCGVHITVKPSEDGDPQNDVIYSEWHAIYKVPQTLTLVEDIG